MYESVPFDLILNHESYHVRYEKFVESGPSPLRHRLTHELRSPAADFIRCFNSNPLVSGILRCDESIIAWNVLSSSFREAARYFSSSRVLCEL